MSSASCSSAVGRRQQPVLPAGVLFFWHKIRSFCPHQAPQPPQAFQMFQLGPRPWGRPCLFLHSWGTPLHHKSGCESLGRGGCGNANQPKYSWTSSHWYPHQRGSETGGTWLYWPLLKIAFFKWSTIFGEESLDSSATAALAQTNWLVYTVKIWRFSLSADSLADRWVSLMWDLE